MKILAFDTATRATAAAIVEMDTEGMTVTRSGSEASGALNPPRVGVSVSALEARDDPPAGGRPRHTGRLMALIVEVLERSGSGWEDVHRLAVGVGPGTFTGLRIGIATARALAQARGIPLVGVSTLESLAVSAGVSVAGPGSADTVLAVLDARRGEVFAAAWTVSEPAGGPRQAALAPLAMAPQELVGACRQLGGSLLMVGDGAVAFRRVLERSEAWIPEDDSPLHRVSAISHGRLAAGRRPAAPGDVQPEYLRAPDAELALHRA